MMPILTRWLILTCETEAELGLRSGENSGFLQFPISSKKGSSWPSWEGVPLRALLDNIP
jgi:hypothetical protein